MSTLFHEHVQRGQIEPGGSPNQFSLGFHSYFDLTSLLSLRKADWTRQHQY